MSHPTLTVIKLGGALLDDAALSHAAVSAIAALRGDAVVVHGGGRAATELADRLGVTTRMIDGRRITDDAMLDVVTMVYGGSVNRSLVASLQSGGRNAIGLTGADADIVRAVRRPAEPVDFGHVGDIVRVDGAQLLHLVDAGLTPVVAPLTHDGAGGILNTNADTMAARIATACASFRQVQLILAFEHSGVLDAEGSVIRELRGDSVTALTQAGVLHGGMLPKLRAAFDALDGGVSRVCICHAGQIAAVAAGRDGIWTEIRSGETDMSSHTRRE